MICAIISIIVVFLNTISFFLMRKAIKNYKKIIDLQNDKIRILKLLIGEYDEKE